MLQYSALLLTPPLAEGPSVYLDRQTEVTLLPFLVLEPMILGLGLGQEPLNHCFYCLPRLTVRLVGTPPYIVYFAFVDLDCNCYYYHHHHYYYYYYY